MPGPYIHMAAADRIAAHLRRQDVWPRYRGDAPLLAGPDPHQLARVALAHPNYYALGAFGPDLFFFLPDFRSPGLANSLVGVLDFLDGFFEALDEFIIERWDRFIGPISENLDEAISRLTGDLSTVVSDIFNALASLLVNMLLDLATQAKDWFGLFSLGHNRGYDNRDFFWSDMLHYRKTSWFGRQLWQIAGERETPRDGETAESARAEADKLRAYALGYITHLGTDVTGHPFVNEKAGGPFRTHWQRHHLVENHMDARCYDADHSTAPAYRMLTEAALHFRLLFGEDENRTLPPTLPGSGSLRGRYERRRILDADSDMPAGVAEQIFEAMKRAYEVRAAADDDVALAEPSRTTPKIIPGDGRPAPETIQQTFGLVFRYLRHITLDGFGHDKPLPPEVFPNLDFPTYTDPHDSAPGAADDDWDFWDVLLAILRFIFFIVEIAIWVATVIPGIINDLLTYGPRVAAYYAIELPLYYIVKASRMVLVMTGYMLPMKDEIDTGLVRLGVGSRQAFLMNLGSINDVFGGIDPFATGPVLQRADELVETEGLSRDEALARALSEKGIGQPPPPEPVGSRDYPHAIVNDGSAATEYHAPWLYPTSKVEQPATVASPHRTGEEAPVLLAGANPGSQRARALFEHCPTPDATEAVARVMPRVGNLGDPVHFSSYLIWQITRDDLTQLTGAAAPPSHETGSAPAPSRFTDWNLDADRGYAWKCWDWDRCKGRESVDETGHTYLTPRSPTPQDGEGDLNPAYQPSTPLRVHYTDHPDQTPVDCPKDDDGGTP